MRKFLLGLFCTALLLCGTLAAAETKAPVALYTFDTGDLADTAGNGYTGTACGAKNLTFVTAPGRGGVLELNNGGLKRDTGASGFKIPTDGLKSATAFTIVMDMYVQTDGTHQNWFDLSAGSNTASSPRHYLVVLLAYKTLGINAELKTTLVGGTSSVRAYNNVIFDKAYQWSQIAYVNDGGVATIYLDGEVVATKDQKRTIADMLTVEGTTLTVGMSSFWNDPGLDARIDNVAVYDSALTAAELDALVSAADGVLGDVTFPDLGRNGLAAEHAPLNSVSLTKGNYLVTYVDEDIAIDDAEELLRVRTGADDYLYTGWTGRIAAPEDGNYTFYLYSDNGVRLYIDGECVIDWWVTQWDKEQTSATVYLEKGVPHEFKLEWFEYTGGSHVLLRWKNDKNVAKTVVPASAFYLPTDFSAPTVTAIDTSAAQLDRGKAEFGGTVVLSGHNLQNAESFSLIGMAGVGASDAPVLTCIALSETTAALTLPGDLAAGRYRVRIAAGEEVTVSEDFITVTAAASDISRPEHPDPAWQREDWVSLNGWWDFAFDPDEVGIIEQWYNGEKVFDQKINVPYPWESALSGIENTEYRGQVWYSRTLTVPETWLAEGKAVYVRFGAVDAKCKVYVNGKEVSAHDGGYTPFEMDITDCVTAGDNTLTLWVEDKADYDNDTYPALIGKQGHNAPCGYTHTSGIWQTVYMECRSETHLGYAHANGNIALADGETDSVQFDLQILSDAEQTLTVNYAFASKLWDESLGEDVPVGSSFTASHTVSVAVGTNTVEMPAIPIENAKWWSPDAPNLYYGTITLADADGNTLDSVDTYFGLREVYTANFAERAYEYIYLNGAPIFMSGLLDQGFWQEGIYTAPDEAALKYDILEMKKLGFNTIRKHLKIEDPLQYYWCDKLGMLVWQDMPHAAGMNAAAQGDAAPGRAIYEEALLSVLDRDYNRPSIVLMVLFNETWGIEHEAPAAADGMTTHDWMQSVFALTKETAPHLLVEDMSACNEDHIQPTDVVTYHEYSISYAQALDEHLRHFTNAEIGSGFEFCDGFSYEGEPLLNSEYGGVGAYQGDLDVSLCFKYLTDLLRMQEMLCGYIYTEPYDIEYERNGILSYDRRAKAFPYGEIAWGGDMTLNDLTQPCFVGICNEPAEEIAAGGTFTADAVAVNWSGKTFENAALHWRFDATDALGNAITTGLAGTTEIIYAPYVAEYYTLSFTLPEQPCVGTVTVWIEENGEKIAKNFVNVIVTGEIAEIEYFSDTSVALRDTDADAAVSGTGLIVVEYALPDGFAIASLSSMRVLAEVSSNKESTLNYGIVNSATSQTVEGGERPSDLTVYVNGIEIDTVYLPDNPRDIRAALTINSAYNGGSSAGNFGYLVNLRVGADKMDAVREAIAADGKITVTYAVKEDTQKPNGLRLYGSATGRYMLAPTVVLNPMDTETPVGENYAATATLSDGESLSLRGGAMTATLADGVLTFGGESANIGEGAHTVTVCVFDTHYRVYADSDPVPVIDLYNSAAYTSAAVSTTGDDLIIAPETYAHLLGDVNSDGILTIVDALLALRACVNNTALDYADANDDGGITLADVLRILKRIVQA